MDQLRGFPIKGRSAHAKVTLPVLLSMGVGQLQSSQRYMYQNIKHAPSSPDGRIRSLRPSRLGRSNTWASNQPEVDEESEYSDGSFYDSEDSYDMRLLAHRKQRRRIHRKPINERIQYLYDDIGFFSKPRPKPKIAAIVFWFVVF